MFCGGCDVGSRTAKAVILDEDKIASSAVLDTGSRPEEAALSVMGAALHGSGICMEDLVRIVGTGYGRRRIPFAHAMESEISCHGLAAWWSNPSARSVIDIGGQDAKAIRLAPDGRVIRYMYNDKCASGTGRFLEIMAEALNLSVEKLDETAERAVDRCLLSSQCVIFAETEVISLLNAGRSLPDVIAGLHFALAGRVAGLARGIGVEAPVVMTGGVAKNNGVFRALAETLGIALIPMAGRDPQLAGAFGAALKARQQAGRG